METLLGMSEIAPFTNHPFTHSLYLNNSQRRLPCILTELNATIGDVASIKGLIFRVERIQALRTAVISAIHPSPFNHRRGS